MKEWLSTLFAGFQPHHVLLIVVGGLGSITAMISRYRNDPDYTRREAVSDGLLTLTLGMPVALLVGMII